VTPNGFGDNVLVQLRPDPRVTEADVEDIFEEIFTQCAAHEAPPAWSHVPESFRTWQERAVKDYDLHAIWKGVRGPVKDPVTGKDVPALPLANQLWPANAENIAAGQWPQYFVGGFPNCFTLPKAEGHAMGQAPGTYWYHSHKHGSTSINLFNGLSGAMIIEGDYDADLAKIYGPALKKNEKVLVFQVYEDLPDLERPRASRGTKASMTNGTQVVAAVKANPTATPPVVAVEQKAPTIVMRPGEIQLWRIVNAQVAGNINGSFSGPAGATISPLPAFRQIAQDGVQFNLVNYNAQPLTTPDAHKNGTKFTLPAGGRIDILVKAPALATGTTSQKYELAGLVNLLVCGEAFTPDAAYPNGGEFPDDDNYPKFPDFLADIGACTPCKVQRNLSFDWEPFRIQPGEASATTHQLPPDHDKMPFPVKVGDGKGGKKEIIIDSDRAPYFMIDNEQFSEHKYYQTMVLGDTEEWTIINTTKVPHPFHIHVNPFQVVESYDPNLDPQYTKGASGNYVREQNGVWQDNVVIPSALKVADATGNRATGALIIDPKTGLATVPGYVRIRSRFVDFPGTYVLHCHILAHEDRGMMQLVRVIDGATPIKHH
jgi:FtsP/CotA-like multicopper oxidase with cupredoxin domain